MVEKGVVMRVAAAVVSRGLGQLPTIVCSEESERGKHSSSTSMLPFLFCLNL